MPENIRALIVVFFLALPAFHIARRVAGTADREFAAWRAAWFVCTAAAFLIYNIYIFFGVLIVICIWAHSARIATPGLFIVLLLAVPPVGIVLSGFGIVQTLLELNSARVLCIVLLAPLLFRGTGARSQPRARFDIPDRFIIGYALLMITLGANRGDITWVLRSLTQYFIDMIIPYFAFSRSVTNLTDVRKVLMAFIVASLPMAIIGVFETAKGWPLYGSVVSAWGSDEGAGLRAGLLRASASASGPIVLGFVLMVAIGCLLATWQAGKLDRAKFQVALAAFAAGLLATLSRGPWIGAIVLVCVFTASGRGTAGKLGKVAVVCIAVALPLLLTPLGDQFFAFLPFTNQDDPSVVYRQRLFWNSVEVIGQNLWLGSADYLLTPEMQELKQGQGIIDIVDSYLTVALSSGLIGLFLFTGFFVAILIRMRRTMVRYTGVDRNVTLCNRALFSTLVAMLVTIATVSSVGFIPYLYWSFAGLCVALVRATSREEVAKLESLYANRPNVRGSAPGLPFSR
jgi:hypothetical protein